MPCQGMTLWSTDDRASKQAHSRIVIFQEAGQSSWTQQQLAGEV
jgi:hypothetical protein